MLTANANNATAKPAQGPSGKAYAAPKNTAAAGGNNQAHHGGRRVSR